MVDKILSVFRKYQILFYIIVVSCIAFSCANMASPSGGPYDFDPPKVVSSTPVFNATNVTKSRIEIIFDELVQLEKAMEKIIVTPPQIKAPNIQAVSNRVIVEIRDTLLPNTTYTIDFTDAIVDNNEKNVLENFAFSFSTGPNIDSLAISGKVLAADNLEPVKGIYVGLHSNLADSAFTTLKFDRISRTNDVGEFTIKGVAEGKYRIYALADANRDYRYDNPSEAVAFEDSIIVPSHIEAFRTDTVFNADYTVDTVKTVSYTKFLPDNVMLRSFLSDFRRQYLQKYERPKKDELNIYFGASTTMPEIKPLNFDVNKTDWAILERTAKNDTLHFWLIDPEVIALDTISLQMAYYKTDSLNLPVITVDTLRFIDRTKKEKDKKKEDEIKFFAINTNLRGSFNVYDKINIEFEHPVRDFDESKFNLQRLVDTLYVDEKIQIDTDSLNPRKFSIKHKWSPGADYKFSIDSASFHNYAGLGNDKLESKFKVKTLDQYGDLFIELEGLEPGVPAFVELLNNSDKAVRRSTVRNSVVGFTNIDPGIYYARIIIDNNNNGIWDTGDYSILRQPEMVYYYNKSFEIKAYFEHEERWNITEPELAKQKPLEITKNKPQERESKKKQLEKKDEDQRKQQEAQKEQQERLRR